MDLEAFREQLVIWGITPNILAGLGIASIITLFFSLRVVAKWFFGFYQIQDELAIVRKQLASIQAQLMLGSTGLKTELQTDVEIPTDIKSKTKSESFRLTNH